MQGHPACDDRGRPLERHGAADGGSSGGVLASKLLLRSTLWRWRKASSLTGLVRSPRRGVSGLRGLVLFEQSAACPVSLVSARLFLQRELAFCSELAPALLYACLSTVYAPTLICSDAQQEEVRDAAVPRFPVHIQSPAPLRGHPKPRAQQGVFVQAVRENLAPEPRRGQSERHPMESYEHYGPQRAELLQRGDSDSCRLQGIQHYYPARLFHGGDVAGPVHNSTATTLSLRLVALQGSGIALLEVPYWEADKSYRTADEFIIKDLQTLDRPPEAPPTTKAE